MKYDNNWDDRPEVIAACLSCPYAGCDGNPRCPRRRAAIRKLAGETGAGLRRGRPARLYELDGEARSLEEWAAEAGMSWRTLYERVNRQGLDLREALERPVVRGGARRGFKFHNSGKK